MNLTANPSLRLARLARHLEARLRDFAPGTTQVLPADQNTGTVSVRFPGRDTAQVAALLEHRSDVPANLSGDWLAFQLSPDLRFEDLDHLWGCILEILEP